MLSTYHRTRFLLWTAALASFAAFWWAGQWARIPVNPGFEDSLLMHISPAKAIVTVAVMLAICTALGTLVAGRIRFNAGLVAACLGLAALSVRSGSSRYTAFWGLAHGDTPARIYARLLFELIILSAFVGACWWALRSLYLGGIIRDRESPSPDSAAPTDNPATPGHTRESENRISDLQIELRALGVQLLATLILVNGLAATETKAQVLVAVFFGAFLGPVIAHWFYESGRVGWHWFPPLVVGMLGYAIAIFSHPGADLADLSGTFAGLARPLPLDYAGMGTAGAILGHWMSRRWAREREAEKAQS